MLKINTEHGNVNELSKHNKQWLSMLIIVLSTSGLFSALGKTLKHSTVLCVLKLLFVLESNPVLLKNSTEHPEPLFITFLYVGKRNWKR